jgi:hypothetical protein
MTLASDLRGPAGAMAGFCWPYEPIGRCCQGRAREDLWACHLRVRNRTAETRLHGWVGRTPTCKRRFEKAVEILGEFLLDYGTFWDQRLFNPPDDPVLERAEPATDAAMIHRVYGAAVIRRLRAMGIRDKPIAAGSPWQNGFAERLIKSIRRECTDHVVALALELAGLRWLTWRTLDPSSSPSASEPASNILRRLVRPRTSPIKTALARERYRCWKLENPPQGRHPVNEAPRSSIPGDRRRTQRCVFPSHPGLVPP